MGLSVELFALDKNKNWIYIECLYDSMIGPSRRLISNQVDCFVWGSADNHNGSSEWYLTESSKVNVTKMSFGILKKIWKDTLNEDLNVNNKNINEFTTVCIATGE